MMPLPKGGGKLLFDRFVAIFEHGASGIFCIFWGHHGLLAGASYIIDMSKHVYKHHNKTLLLYHLVFPVKYRREVFNESVSTTLKEVCIGISMRYKIGFVEVGMDEDHVHFLVQSVPTMSVSKIVTILKSIAAREILSRHKEVKKLLWGGNLWTSGSYANTMS